MNIPGMAAKHLIITRQCRENHGDDNRRNYVMGLIDKEIKNILNIWPKESDVKIRVVVLVEPKEKIKNDQRRI